MFWNTEYRTFFYVLQHLALFNISISTRMKKYSIINVHSSLHAYNYTNDFPIFIRYFMDYMMIDWLINYQVQRVQKHIIDIFSQLSGRVQCSQYISVSR